MSLYILDNDFWFPNPEEATEDGLLAVGGDLHPDRLVLAYQKGIFPWFNEDEPPMWWCPDPRFVLFPENLKVSSSMRQLLKKQAFEFRVDTAFESVIRYCRLADRKGQDGTWISKDVMASYAALHQRGYAHSAEAWLNGELVGGLYGIRMGNLFFGESMFARASNASKYAFISYVRQLQQEGVQLIDCQVYTEHLESLGARMIPRKEFLSLLAANIPGAPYSGSI